MFIYPNDAFERLEYSKVLEHIRQYCLSEAGGLEVLHTQIETDLHVIEDKLKETEEFRNIIERGENFPISGFESVTKDIILLSKEGYVLDVEAIQRIYFVIYISMTTQTYANDKEKKSFFNK